MSEKCGSTDTTTGEPCGNPAGSCPYHGEGDSPDVGRPKMTLGDLPDDWKDTTLSMYEEGASDTEVMAELGFGSRHTFHRFLDDHEEFLQTIKRGRMLSQAWWMKQGRDNLATPKGLTFNHQLWKVNMENRFDWSERQTIEADVDAEVESHEVVEEYAEMFEEDEGK